MKYCAMYKSDAIHLLRVNRLKYVKICINQVKTYAILEILKNTPSNEEPLKEISPKLEKANMVFVKMMLLNEIEILAASTTPVNNGPKVTILSPPHLILNLSVYPLTFKFSA